MPTTDPLNAEIELRQAAQRINRVITGLERVFDGGPTETVNNGSKDLPTIDKLLSDANARLQLAVDPVLQAASALRDASAAAAQQAADSAAAALAAFEKGNYLIYNDRTTANDAIGSGLAEGDYALILQDETNDDLRTLRQVQSGTLEIVFEPDRDENILTATGDTQAVRNLNLPVRFSTKQAALAALSAGVLSVAQQILVDADEQRDGQSHEYRVGAGALEHYPRSREAVIYARTEAEVSAGVTPTRPWYPPSNVLRYGAVGDGDADDTLALQTAVSVMSHGDALYFPKGTYKLSGTLTVSGLSHIAVFGKNAKLIQTASKARTLYFSGGLDIQVYGMHLVGKGSADHNGANTSAGLNACGMLFDNCSGLNVHHNRLENHSGGHIRTRYGSPNSKFVLNTIVGIGTAGGIASGDNNVDAGIDLREGAGFKNSNVVVAGNDVSQTCFGIFISDADGAVVSHNVVRDIPGQHGVYAATCKNIAYVANSFRNIALVAIKAQQLPANDQVYSNVSAIGNTIDGVATGVSYELISGVTGSYTDGILISENNIANCSEYGMSVDSVVNGVLIGNSIRETTEQGIFLRRSGEVSVVSNLISRTGANSIWAFACTGDVDIVGNTCIDACLNPNSGMQTDGRFYYYIFVDKAAGISTTPQCLLASNTLKQRGSVPPQFAANGKCVRVLSGVDVYWDRNRNFTGKPWQFESGRLKQMDVGFSPSVDYTSGANLSPSQPVYGRGRRELFGTQDPQSAAMTDTFRQGDFCWNADPVAGGTLGWTCISSGAPGVWKAVGAIAV